MIIGALEQEGLEGLGKQCKIMPGMLQVVVSHLCKQNRYSSSAEGIQERGEGNWACFLFPVLVCRSAREAHVGSPDDRHG